MPKRKKSSAQLDLLALLPSELIADRTERGITIRLRASSADRPPTQTASNSISNSNSNLIFAELPVPADLPVTYQGIRVVNGKVIREGRHSASEWNYVGLAGAVPRRIHDYDPDVILERRADLDGVVRLLPVPNSAGEALRELEYVVVDVETTGAGFSSGHRVTEVAIVRLNGQGKVVDDYTTLINPERPIPPMITELTNIDGWMVRDAPRFRDVAQEVRARLDGCIFVAHNAGFDWNFLSLELLRALGKPLRGRMLCTVRMARKLVPELRRRSLDSLSYFFNVPNEARHRAFGDARATAKVFRRMIDRAEERDISHWNALQKLLYARAPRRKRRATPSFFDPTP